ncbi:hypothetical protein K402DRAFT_398289 [Aulographum hederae CBS 113979]|uniref:Uncharacterized protein n=1 Tax=Aulographum hederae CBS 113979 TaxID=1176131 RepID=A0A6G1GLC9_9PEZI|nr:hypothetical protein K402DRAFT_398289 [Aulographum hederae CBS 113979]
MLLPQLRGYAPLRVGKAQIPVNYYTVALAFFTFVLVFGIGAHFFGSTVKAGALAAAYATGGLPRYWSKTGKGDLGGVTMWKKPEGLKIVGLIFYGRRSSVSILDCYLKRNLAENGGLFDQVLFLARTDKKEDLDWLDVLVKTTPSYRRVNVSTIGDQYASAYDVCEDGTMYIKIDDDIVFIEDSAIPTIAKLKYEHPEYFTVSANIMNQPSLSWVHQHLGAIRPYLPELQQPPETPKPASGWKASALPRWQGPDNFTVTDDFVAPYPHHRWLPSDSIDDTPIMTASYGAFSAALWHWTIAAQEHFSFFEHLEKNELWRYKFHHWDYFYQRMGIQFIAIMGQDINRAKPIDRDDEAYFSEVVPKKLKRHAVVDGRAVVAHYSFNPQIEGMSSTDILDRYRAYAIENICIKQQHTKPT